MSIPAPQLTRDNFATLMRETFRAANINAISIIQGVALSILLTKVSDVFFKGGSLIDDWPFRLPYPIICFVGIFLVTYNYTHYIGTFQRSVSMLDVFIPMLLGTAEIMPIFFIAEHQEIHFWAFEGFFLLTAILAWMNTTRYTTDEYFSIEKARVNYLRGLKAESVCAFIMAIGCFYAAWSFTVEQPGRWLELSYAIGLLCLGTVLGFLGRKTLHNLHYDYGVEL